MANDDLSSYLESLDREDRYRVDAVLKKSDIEVTQRVFFQTDNGSESGPYIRKYIARDSGMGSAYERIFQANQAGQTFEHIPNVHDYYLHDNHTVIVMEHINGPTLADVVYENDPSVELARQLFGGLCDAVTELHTKFDPALIHRDLKPSNIIVRNNEPVIIDFGIAREYDDDADTDTTHFGTRAYAPPEQYGYGQTTERSDVYALGMLLYFLLVEQTPNAKAIKNGFKDKRIPEPLRQIITQATAFDPAKRFASAKALKEAFGQALVRGNTLPTPADSAHGLQQQDDTDSAHGLQQQDDIDNAQQAPTQPVIVVEQPIFVQAPTVAPQQAATTQPTYQTTAVPTTPPITTTPHPKKGRARNIAIAIMFVLVCARSIREAIYPTLPRFVAYPRPYSLVMSLFCIPLLLALISSFLVDKDHLKSLIPALDDTRIRNIRILLALLLGASLFILGATAIFTGFSG